MAERVSRVVFIITNVVVWTVMTVVLVIVPDVLERWVSIEVARIIGWGVAGSSPRPRMMVLIFRRL